MVGDCVINTIEVGLMTVFVPPAPSVRHGAASDNSLKVSVPRGKGASVMV